jgi:hypothetical protein
MAPGGLPWTGRVWYNISCEARSTSLALDDQGNVVAESRHYPYGEERWSSGTLPIDYRFIDQRNEYYLWEFLQYWFEWKYED